MLGVLASTPSQGCTNLAKVSKKRARFNAERRQAKKTAGSSGGKRKLSAAQLGSISNAPLPD